MLCYDSIAALFVKVALSYVLVAHTVILSSTWLAHSLRMAEYGMVWWISSFLSELLRNYNTNYLVNLTRFS